MKRLGIGKHGLVESEGKIRISSAFSNMRSLPKANPNQNGYSNFSLDHFISCIEKGNGSDIGLVLSSHDDILVDNLQGVVTLKTDKKCNIEVQSVESANMVIDAPNANVSLNLKSLNDLSHIRCNKASIYLSQK